MRKKANLKMTDKVELYLGTPKPEPFLEYALKACAADVDTRLGQPFLNLKDLEATGAVPVVTDKFKVKTLCSKKNKIPDVPVKGFDAILSIVLRDGSSK